MSRLLALAAVAVIIGVIVWSFSGLARELARRPRRAKRTSGAVEWESRYDQLYRKWKTVGGPTEDHEGMMLFIRSRSGVEAYLEPRTMAHPLSVVLVAGDGEWKRFELSSDAFVRELAREIGLPTFDAARVGYPPRMREYRRPPEPRDEPRDEPRGDAGGEGDAVG